MVFYAEFTDINLAINTEKQIKNWSRAKKEALINGEFDKLPNLAKKNFDSWFVLDTICSHTHKSLELTIKILFLCIASLRVIPKHEKPLGSA